MKYLILFFLISNGWASDTLETKLDKLNQRVTEMELEHQLQKVHFSGTFINRLEMLHNQHGVPGAAATTEDLSAIGMYFGFNADFDISKNIQFYSTLGMSKLFNNEGRTENSSYDYANAETGGYSYSGSTPRIDKAYMAYQFDTTPLTLAIGRMSTNGGPPDNQLDGLSRQGTYPSFMLNAIFDGIAAVYNFSQYLPEQHSFKIRAFHQPFIIIDKTDRTKQLRDGTSTLGSHSSQLVVLNEYSFKSNSGFERFDLMYMHMKWNGFYMGSAATTAPAGSPPAGQLEYGNENGFFLSFENIGHLGLNFSWSGLRYAATDSATPDLHKVAWGHLFNLNEKLVFLNGNWQKVILGYQFVTSEKYFYTDYWATLNLIPFYALQANKGHHAYVSFPLAEKLNARVGYMTINAKAGDFVQPEATKAHSVYGQIRLDF